MLIARLIFAVLASPAALRAQTSPADLVHEFIGTASEGQTFPSTGVPFAMTDWTPQTRDGEVKCVSPYYSVDSRIQGFRGSHFLSGSCTQDYGSFTIMPVAGELKLKAADRASGFRRASESARPYLYRVDLEDYGIHAEMTGTARSGLMRFRYERAGKSWLVIQTNSRADSTGERFVHIDKEKNELWGENAVTRLYAGSGKPAGFRGYFVMQFDRRFQSSGKWEPNGSSTAASGNAGGAFLSFDLRPGQTVQVRIGTSFTSVEEARRNLRVEIPEWNFERTVESAHSAWDDALGRVTIAGSAPERVIFYTALYHSLMLPRIASDVDGSYSRFGGGDSVEKAKGFTYYDDYSIWDTFRALHPLLTILDAAREAQMVQSLVVKGTQGGFLPIYPAWNSYTSEMIGDHADAIIVDAYAKGIRGFDVSEAYRLMRHNAMDEPSPAEYADGKGRRALASYMKYGYIPLEDHVAAAFHHDEQVSRTLEYAYDDFLVGKMAAALGKTADAALFQRRSGNWRNMIDPESGFARGRHADGSWVTPFDPSKTASFITEGLPFQYTFFVPQDVPGLIAQLHGKEALEAKLDALFARGLYDQGNEPSHHIAYLYNFTGAAWKTQLQVRNLMDSKYTDRVDGLAGNEDAGQMSAWYVMSALGLYAVTPGVPEYEITAPRFDDMTVHLSGGRKLHLVAPGSESGAKYITGVSLNGRVLRGHSISHAAVMGGGELRYTLSRDPGKSWPSR